MSVGSGGRGRSGGGRGGRGCHGGGGRGSRGWHGGAVARLLLPRSRIAAKRVVRALY